MQKSNEFFVGLDIGTSAVRCVVGTMDYDEQTPKISVVGAGSAPNHGMRKGTVVHAEEVANAIGAALEEAERLSGAHIRDATVLVNGAHVSSQSSKGVVAISGAGRHITDEDRARVEEAATVIQMPANREIIQVFAKNYRIDGQDNIKDPVGMQGVRLEVDAQIISASTPILHNLDYAIERAGVNAKNRVTAGLAAAEAVLDRSQKESGTAVVDIGAGTTNIVILEEGEIELVAVLPVGSQHITNDLAIGLKTDIEVAEKIKRKFARLDRVIGQRQEPILIDDEEFDPKLIRMIVESRVEEMLELVEKEFAKVKKAKKLPGGVVFVGGGSNLPGLAEFAKDKLDLPTKLGVVKGISGLADIVANPEYATATGLMLLDVLLSGAGSHSGKSEGMNTKSFVSKIKKIFLK
jgi:cell division protein FtsA